MSTYDLTTVPNTAYQIYTGATTIIRKHVFDIADMTSHNAADVAQVVPVYAGEFVKDVFFRIITKSTTGSSTVDIGDGNGTASYQSATSCTATNGTVTASTGAYIFTQSNAVPYAVTYVGGTFYAAADTIDVKLGGTPPANGVFEVIVHIVPISTDSAV